MNIELFKDPESDMLIPFINGKLQKDFFEFLVYRFNWPAKLNLKPVSGSSLKNIAYDIKQLIETLAHNNIHISEANYHSHIKKILDEQQNVYGWTNETYNNKYRRCREFFQFLELKGINYESNFPKRRSIKLPINSDDNFYNHQQNIDAFSDDGCKRTVKHENYLHNVISMDTYYALYTKLENIDPVYAVIAQTLMQSCLRVSNVSQLPFSHSTLNPKWFLWPEFEALELEFLKFHHIAKGNKVTWCYIWPATIKSIYQDYISKYYEERKILYTKTYSKRKNFSLSQGRVELPADVLWLNKNGTPIKPYMIEEAFRKTELNVTPHTLRHTGATHLLWNYCNILGIEPDEKMASQFHSFLQFQLGHQSIETTRFYIRTIIRRKAQYVVPFAIPANRAEIDSKLPIEALEHLKMFEFFAGSSNGISKHQKLMN